MFFLNDDTLVLPAYFFLMDNIKKSPRFAGGLLRNEYFKNYLQRARSESPVRLKLPRVYPEIFPL